MQEDFTISMRQRFGKLLGGDPFDLYGGEHIYSQKVPR